MVDDPDDATGPSHSQKGMTGAAVVGPCTSVEVFVSLHQALSQGNNWPRQGHYNELYQVNDTSEDTFVVGYRKTSGT